MKLYNTMSREKETFEAICPPVVGIYSCGPTVYNTAHIGNLRTYIFMDTLRRVLKLNGFKLNHVMNITDVGHLTDDADDGEDKMQKSARERQMSPYAIAEQYTAIFLRDIDRLNIERPEIVPKATDHIAEMIRFVEGLIEKGYGYETSDGIYFDIGKFAGYGKLSHLNLEEQQAGARVEVNAEKRHPADFALWKKAPKSHIMQWESPWGMGYPGWHIECSAMGLKYLGETFDIHTGGVDHIPVHHENEIAQSEGLLGHPAARYWLHGEFMLVDGGKMSKSLGNTYSLDELSERGFSPAQFRYFCSNAHYRSKLNFTFEGMESAAKAYGRLLSAVDQHKGAPGEVPEDVLGGFWSAFKQAVDDDLNIPKALGVTWNAARHSVKSQAIYALIMEMDAVLGLSLDAGVEEETAPDIDEAVQAMIEARQAARKAKNFAEADRIRDALKEQGILLEDTPEGVKWKRV
ncbi:cysteine--tRNA ligase [Oscillospiraceae bacterium OttesenSCG-928-F05]|nr:cysteine--tRNA ligase [Oscillospiraceae bacterium OttesenSCG-928-F05]